LGCCSGEQLAGLVLPWAECHQQQQQQQAAGCARHRTAALAGASRSNARAPRHRLWLPGLAPLARLAAAARCDGDLGPPRRVPLARHVLRSKKLRTKARPEKNHEENEHAIQTLSQKYSLKTPRIKTKLEQ